MTMITQVFTKKGESDSISNVITKLCKLNSTDPFRLKKALGSIGGAVNSGFIKIIDGMVTRVR